MSSHSDSLSEEHLAQAEQPQDAPRIKLEVAFAGGGPMSILLPTDTVILQEARRFALNRDSSLNDFATCVSQDPIIIMELLRAANSSIVTPDRPPVTLAKNAVIQLGMARVLEIIDQLATRESLVDREVHDEFERLRSRARRCSILARILSMTHHRDLAPEAQTAGLMVELGHMLACIYFGQSYAHLVQQVNRGTLNYRLQQEQHFDVKKMQMTYLKRMGFPEPLLFALDRDTQCKTPHRIAMRHVVESAAEMVEAFDSGKWQKLAPGKNLPINSSLRLLRFDETQYQRVWERCNEYLHLAQEEERVRRAAASTNSHGLQVQQPVPPTINHHSIPQPSPDPIAIPEVATKAATTPVTTETIAAESTAPSQPNSAVGNNAKAPEEQFVKLLFPPAPPPQFNDSNSSVARPQLNSKQAQAALVALCELCESIENTSDLLEEIIETLIQEGPFVRAGLFVVSENRRTAAVIRAAGQNLEAGTQVSFSDPTNPLASCMQQVRSFNSGSTTDISAPLGISSYAVAPINVRHNTPVFLYADCGSDRSMTFEARKLFRYVVGLLNSTLPNIAGDLPS